MRGHEADKATIHEARRKRQGFVSKHLVGNKDKCVRIDLDDGSGVQGGTDQSCASVGRSVGFERTLGSAGFELGVGPDGSRSQECNGELDGRAAEHEAERARLI